MYTISKDASDVQRSFARWSQLLERMRAVRPNDNQIQELKAVVDLVQLVEKSGVAPRERKKGGQADA